MTRDDIIAMAKEAGIHIDVLPDEYCSAVGLPSGGVSRWDGVGIDEVRALIRLATAKERERIAAEFDRRAAIIPGSGWYEPHEPAEIARAMAEPEVQS